MALTKNTPLAVEVGNVTAAPVLASTTIYEGALVGIQPTTGYARGLVAGDIFLGHAFEEADNSSGSSADINVTVRSGRYLAKATITSVAVTDVGKEVYASDDGTLSLSNTGTRVGRVVRYDTTNTAIVEFETVPMPTACVGSSFVHEIDCGAAAAEDAVTLIPAYMNRNGLVLLGVYGIVTEVFAGSSEDQGVVTVSDSDANALSTLTVSDGGADAQYDIVLGTNPAIAQATGTAVKVLAANKGITAVATQLTEGTPAGKLKVFCLVKFL